MEEYTIRNAGDGSIICRGYFAESAEGAEADFLADCPAYQDGDIYADPSQWND